MGYSQADKALNRERILTHAAEKMRDEGLESISVGKVMRSVDLTHGGFYGHFSSRSDLLAQALERALLDGEARVGSTVRPGKQPDFPKFLRGYLSRVHRDARATGCAMSSLISDVGRADPSVRAVMEAHLEGFIALIDQLLDGGQEDRAIFAISAMIGAINVSRVMTDSKRSDFVLRAVRDQLLAWTDPSASR